MMMKVRHYPGHAEPVLSIDEHAKSMAAQYEASWKECDAKWRVNDRHKFKTNSTNNSNSWSYEQFSRPPVLSNYLKANSVADIGLNGDKNLESRSSSEESDTGDLHPASTTSLPNGNSVQVLNSCQTYAEPDPSKNKDFHKSKESINVERLDQIIHNPNASPLRYFNRQRVAPKLIDDSWIPPPLPPEDHSKSSHSLSRRSFHVKNNVPNTLKRVKSLHVNSIKDKLDQKERKSSLHGPTNNSDVHESHHANNVIPNTAYARQLAAWDVINPHSHNHTNKPLDLRKSDSSDSVRLPTPEKNGRKPQRSSPVEVLPEPDYPVQTDSSNGDFIIPRPKLIVPVHTYGVRKRRTGANVSKRKGSEEMDATPKSTVEQDKKHHTSCPGKHYSVSVVLNHAVCRRTLYFGL